MSAAPEGPHTSDVVSLAPLGTFFRRFRPIFLFGLTGLLILGLTLVAVAWRMSPVTHLASQDLSITFRGAQKGEYPNGLPFSIEELLDPVVLRIVYDRQNLSQWLDFEAFRAALSVSIDPGEVHKIRREYEGRLTDPKLAGPDRRRLEEEFLSRIQTSSAGLYQVGWFEFGRERGLVPWEVKARVLAEIPAVWADQAVRIRQVLFFPVALPGSSLRKGEALKVLADLDSRSRVLDEALGEMVALPGGDQAVLGDGSNLADLSLRLRSFREQELPLVQQSFFAGLRASGEREGVAESFRMQLQSRDLVAARMQGRLQALLETYQDYLAGRPGISSEMVRSGSGDGGERGSAILMDESFLGRLLDLTQGGTDRGYRQKIVAEIDVARQEATRARQAAEDIRQNQEVFLAAAAAAKAPPTALTPPPPSADRASGNGSAASSLPTALNTLDSLLASSGELLASISGSYLGRDVSLYELAGPFQTKEFRALGLRPLAMAFFAWVALGSAGLLLLTWGYSRLLSLRRSVRRSP